MSGHEDYAADACDSRWDYAEEPEMEEERTVTSCPKCGSTDIYDKIRQYPDRPGIIDMGWECDACGWQWGFEMSELGPGEEKP